MAKVEIYRRGHEAIVDTLHFEAIDQDARGSYALMFKNISDTADLRYIRISMVKVEIPFAPRGELTSWISVKEKVPDYGVWVLIYFKTLTGGTVLVMRRSHTDVNGHHWMNGTGHNELQDKCVTHWMPLPEPPKEYVDMQVTPLKVPYPSVKGPDGEGPGSEE